MSSTLIIILGVAGGVLVALGIVWAYGRSQYKRGAADATVEVQQANTEAKRRADAVLAEHRDPTDADKRLRDGTF